MIFLVIIENVHLANLDLHVFRWVYISKPNILPHVKKLTVFEKKMDGKDHIE
jgi:hypothetical protein